MTFSISSIGPSRLTGRVECRSDQVKPGTDGKMAPHRAWIDGVHSRYSSQMSTRDTRPGLLIAST